MVKGYLPEALKVYTVAAEAAHEQREIEHICLYEKGMCRLNVCSIIICMYAHTHCINIQDGCTWYSYNGRRPFLAL